MKNGIIVFIALMMLLLLSSCGVKEHRSSSRPITHELWDGLLKQYVTEDGQVNYKGIIQDSVRFYKYIDLLENHHPNESNWTKDEQLAYWINAYNAFTVQLIIENYPLTSIKDIKKGLPFINTVWDIKFINIEGANYDLNNIEHSIIRKKFTEPRIHVAVNCASISCPRLRNEAFVAERLDSQLNDNLRYFLANPVKNKFEQDKVFLSKILRWYGGDFKTPPYENVRNMIQQYGPPHKEDAEIVYLDYDWNLNDKQ